MMLEQDIPAFLAELGRGARVRRNFCAVVSGA